MTQLARQAHAFLGLSRYLDFLAPLALRLYLAPIFWIAGTNKLNEFDSIVEWFGNAEWGLGLPFPFLMA
ncbi:MAG TPA: DoxX family membrane protein, partial [Thiothrix sp.]|nr:DoxX family membrane protein [Thiothrix sp.]